VLVHRNLHRDIHPARRPRRTLTASHDRTKTTTSRDPVSTRTWSWARTIVDATSTATLRRAWTTPETVASVLTRYILPDRSSAPSPSVKLFGGADVGLKGALGGSEFAP
jgi:hypothetical protein